ncbi:MAG TPA: GNAT family N-acetyltransferase [Solirubrobacteraceae bacterium]|jgi:GNAT superfamily N-acetyltransferase|nr:GNAT family N-acetyltransferase [Solirubrobacteraceae bacterium]
MNTPILRPAETGDVDTVYELILALAEYERLRHQVRGTRDLLEMALFGPRPAAEAVIAELNSTPVGFALFFHTFSTFQCRPGMWLEDLFVVPEHRRGGIGRLLLSHVASLAVRRGCARLEWSALRWNEPALEFYAALGAETMTEWQTLRLDGEALRALGAEHARERRAH